MALIFYKIIHELVYQTLKLKEKRLSRQLSFPVRNSNSPMSLENLYELEDKTLIKSRFPAGGSRLSDKIEGAFSSRYE